VLCASKQLRALRGYEEVWGAKYTSTLDTVNNLGNLYLNQGKLKEAEEMYVRALRGKEEVWGRSASTLDTIYNLGNLYRDQDELTKARQMYGRVAKGYKEVEGDHEAQFAYL
jgi:TolA-binding protein